VISLQSLYGSHISSMPIKRVSRYSLDTLPWGSPPIGLNLRKDEVHLWSVSLDLKYDDLDTLERTLSTRELTKANRLRFEEDRKEYIAARGILRYLLSVYLHRSPAEIQLDSSPFGKPTVIFPSQAKLRFNLSRRKKLGLYAFTYNENVGVDLENIQNDFSFEEVSRHCFTRSENAAINELPIAQRIAAFFTLWTLKEAYVKASGEGLSLPLNEVEILISKGKPKIFLCLEENPNRNKEWSLLSLVPNEGFIGALVFEGDLPNVRKYRIEAFSELECLRDGHS
jgi:4'-phosphopantetheinyl transferase